MKWQKTATLPTGAFPPAKVAALAAPWTWRPAPRDRKSTRLNSSHSQISYAVFCLKKKNKIEHIRHSPTNTVNRLQHMHYGLAVSLSDGRIPYHDNDCLRVPSHPGVVPALQDPHTT